MIEKQYLQQLEKIYPQYLSDQVLGRPFQAIRLWGGKKKPATVSELYSSTEAFLKYEKQDGKRGWVIEWEPWHSKTLGHQLWPSTIWMEREEDYLYLTGRQKEADLFKRLAGQLLEWNSALAEWLSARPLKVLELQASWKDICPVVNYLLEHDVGAYYIRSLPVPVHTKFLQQQQATILSILKHLQPERFPGSVKTLEDALGLQVKPTLFTVRWLDREPALRYTSGIEVLSVPVKDLRNSAWTVGEIWLVENETNLYLLPHRPGALAVFSKGYALHDLSNLPLFHKTRLFYWGDLDEDGFLMLGQFRQYYPQVQSVLMDEETVSTHLAEMDRVAFRGKQEPSQLTPEEYNAYQQLQKQNGRIEQEKLKQDYIQECLRKML